MILNNLDQTNIKTRRFYTMLMALTVVQRHRVLETQSTLSTYMIFKCSASLGSTNANCLSTAPFWAKISSAVSFYSYLLTTQASDPCYCITSLSALYFKNLPRGIILLIFSFPQLDKTYFNFVIGSQKAPFGAKIVIFGSSQNL